MSLKIGKYIIVAIIHATINILQMC